MATAICQKKILTINHKIDHHLHLKIWHEKLCYFNRIDSISLARLDKLGILVRRIGFDTVIGIAFFE